MSGQKELLIATGPLTNGFGIINAYSTPGAFYGTAPYLQPRSGTIIARFSF